MPLGQEVDHWTAAVLQKSHWGQALHQMDLVHVFGSFTGHNPKYNRSLRVTNVVQLTDSG